MVNFSGMQGEARRFRHSRREAAQSVGPPLLLLLLVNINSNNLVAMKTFVVCAFALVPLTVVAAVSEVAGLAGLPNHPFLYVEGKAEIEKAPELISIHFDISARNADQGKANQEVQAKAKKLFALLKEAKIEDRDVVAQDLHSEPEFERDEADQNKRGKLIGYVVTRSFKVTVRDLTKYGKLGDQIMALGGVKLSYISAEVSDRKKLGEELWPKAIANAREEAEKTLKPMGMKIDSVFAVSSIDFGEIRGEFLKGGERVVVTGMNIPTPPDQPSEYRLEMIVIDSTAHVIYLISPVK
jgi:uncharacterized protein YggE